MPLQIRLTTETSIPVEVDTIRLETVRTQSAAEVAQTLIHYGNKTLPLGEFFQVSGSARDDNTVVWQGDCHKVKLIGTHLSEGTVRVEGNAGMHLGAEMTGGEVIVTGNCGDWVGAEMHGGRIHVHGNVGHLVGAVYRGGRKGMTGGEILVHGNAGNEVGQTMRRGLIAIGGSTGDAIGFNMIAGTILCFGETGIRPGAGMRRGTIGLLGQQPVPKLLPTFRHACTYQPAFLQVYLRHLQQLGFPVAGELLTSHYHRYLGDFIELGKGEVLVPATAV